MTSTAKIGIAGLRTNEQVVVGVVRLADRFVVRCSRRSSRGPSHPQKATKQQSKQRQQEKAQQSLDCDRNVPERTDFFFFIVEGRSSFRRSWFKPKGKQEALLGDDGNRDRE
jgi:hypothetical protein